jgi:hypothetical protein
MTQAPSIGPTGEGMMRKLIATGTGGGLALLLALPAAAQTVKIEFITEIRPPHIQSGIKSHQTISLDLASDTAKAEVTTGVTEVIPGWSWGSVRDKFELTNVSFGRPQIRFTTQGQTASALLVMPDIDYKFSVILNRDQKKYWISGCHNRFPSYRILINSKSVYDHAQVGNAFTGLFGVCDAIAIPEGSY